MNCLFGQLKMHSVDGIAGKARFPEPSKLIEKWSQQKIAAVSHLLPLADNVGAKENVDGRAPAVIGIMCRIMTSGTDAKHALVLDLFEQGRIFVADVLKHLQQ